MLLSSLNKPFVYLSGLMVACSLHISCQSSTSYMDKNDQMPSSYTLSGNIPLSNLNAPFAISTGIDGKEKGRPFVVGFFVNKNSSVRHNGVDASLLKSIPASGIELLAVADGAGNSFASGVMAINLLEYCESYAESHSEKLGAQSLKDMVNYVCTQLQNQSGTSSGETTICIAIIDGNLLVCANVGDSGIKVIRRGKVVFRTKKQMFGFNEPFLINKYDGLEDNLDKFEYSEFILERGDIVIDATDGIWDNLENEDELINIVNATDDSSNNLEESRDSNHAQKIAYVIKTRAYNNSINPDKITSWSREYTEFHKEPCTGGKEDDMSVVVAVIK